MLARVPPKVGNMVHFVLPCCSDDCRFRGNAFGIHRPAVVVSILPTRDERPILMVFLTEHDARGEQEFLRVDYATYDDTEKRPGTWHYPEPEG